MSWLNTISAAKTALNASLEEARSRIDKALDIEDDDSKQPSSLTLSRKQSVSSKATSEHETVTEPTKPSTTLLSSIVSKANQASNYASSITPNSIKEIISEKSGPSAIPILLDDSLVDSLTNSLTGKSSRSKSADDDTNSSHIFNNSNQRTRSSEDNPIFVQEKKIIEEHINKVIHEKNIDNVPPSTPVGNSESSSKEVSRRNSTSLKKPENNATSVLLTSTVTNSSSFVVVDDDKNELSDNEDPENEPMQIFFNIFYLLFS